jgi:hypothetical protein
MDSVVKYANDALASHNRGVGDILRIDESRGAPPTNQSESRRNVPNDQPSLAWLAAGTP